MPLVRQSVPALSLAIALVSACGGRPEPEPRRVDENSLREIAQGTLVGYAGDWDDHAWRGIPFAQPPVGDLRWRSPRAPEPWAGRLEALTQGAACPQFAGPGGGPGGEKAGEPVGDEDCLSVNVFAPRFAPDSVPQDANRLPVMVWIHGGGNTIGSSLLYNGGRLATAHGLVIVTVQYRLGAFGWFSHPPPC